MNCHLGGIVLCTALVLLLLIKWNGHHFASNSKVRWTSAFDPPSSPDGVLEEVSDGQDTTAGRALTCRGASPKGPSRLCSVLVRGLGFACKDYITRSQDGFLLGLQRISLLSYPEGPSVPRRDMQGQGHKAQWGRHLIQEEAGGSKAARKAAVASNSVPVVLQHGLLLRAECWVMSQPGRSSLPFQLAQAGYDVWLGNVRCSPWAAGDGEAEGQQLHFSNNKADWDWSWDELAKFDLPALVTKVLDTTGADSVLYVGHSQGTLILLSSLSMGWMPPDVIRGAYLLAPVAFLGHLSSVFVRKAAAINFDVLVEDTGIHHFSFHNELGQRIVGEVCADGAVNCSSLVTAITGPNCCIDMHRARELLPWLPVSTSVKNMAHFAQAVRRGHWRMFDYGWRNWLIYGTLHPPPYEPANIPPIPIALAYGSLDTLSTPPDVQELVDQLTVKPRVLNLPHYAHLDFILGDTTFDKNLLYSNVLSFFKDI